MAKKLARYTRHTHSPAFKARVALAALREDQGIGRAVQVVRAAPNQITEWKRQLLEHMSDALGGGVKAAEPVDLAPLHAKIAQLTQESVFLEGPLTKARLLSAKR
ncbi:hypothetical protein SAMN05216344_12814 [Polaromonas sp. OV174]|uniref:hypothetical protein n=1 Tax=Polaromonas sp. OV174 TaxID=1855300 RepID=UPI0008F2910B|nr:hypothetical protein [Polaromonas sp. OV174]SFC65828.1 hypothetical protein SAMN05216344_12814 [Polaromonas sp. OV174]